MKYQIYALLWIVTKWNILYVNVTDKIFNFLVHPSYIMHVYNLTLTSFILCVAKAVSVGVFHSGENDLFFNVERDEC